MNYTFRYHLWNPEENNEIYDAIYSILKQKSLESFTSTIFTISKDLLLNGIKANLKRLFFQEIKADIAHPSDYELGVRMYKSKVLHGKLPDYKEAAIENDFYVEINLFDNEKGFFISVKNNQTMVNNEMNKIRSSILHSQNYNDIMEYYLERADDSEGEGIGIALIVLLLKSMNSRLENFQIRNEDDCTIASVEISWEGLQSSTWQ
ncbi:MAG: hypothetical protein GW938_03890 [Leptospira sp.]|nr:hypothetical protein [Leptospira sp.]NCS94003.1 hypothetical protein [Leptospira sp.]